MSHIVGIRISFPESCCKYVSTTHSISTEHLKNLSLNNQLLVMWCITIHVLNIIKSADSLESILKFSTASVFPENPERRFRICLFNSTRHNITIIL